MKTLYYLRHSDKEGQIIGRAGLDLVARCADRFPRALIMDFFHGNLLRTAQTLLAAVAAEGMKGKVHPPIEEIGTDELFAEWKKTCEFGKEGVTNFQALRTGLSDKKFEEARDNAIKGVKIMFDQMVGSTGLAFGHSPVIEAAASKCTHLPECLQLKSLDGVIFIQDDKGNIITKEVIRLTGQLAG